MDKSKQNEVKKINTMKWKNKFMMCAKFGLINDRKDHLSIVFLKANTSR